MRFKVLLISFCFFNVVFSQSEISWTGSYDTENSLALVTAKLEDGWHVYSMTVNEMAGPVSTKFELKENPNIEILGEVKEPKPIVSFDENFQSKLKYFDKKVTFEQELNIKQSTHLEYTVTFMICNDEMCYPPVDEVVIIEVEK